MTDSRRLGLALCGAALACLLALWSWPGERVASVAEVVREGRR